MFYQFMIGVFIYILLARMNANECEFGGGRRLVVLSFCLSEAVWVSALAALKRFHFIH